MKELQYHTLKKYQRKNLNKFLHLKKKKSFSQVIFTNSGLLRENIKKMVDFYLKKNSLSNGFMWTIYLNKNKTKKPMGSKLGGGKGKINAYFVSLKKYKPILNIRFPSDSFLKGINKILSTKLKKNVK